MGTVTDSTGAVVSGAKVKIKNFGTGVEREVQTDGNGNYRGFPLNPGEYEVSASFSGFATAVEPRVVLGVAAAAKLDFTLQVSGASASVTVTSATPLLQTQETSVGGTVTEAELTRLPVNGRNYTRLVLLMAGTSDRAKSQSNGTFSGTNLYSVNGQRAQDNSYTIDGVENNLFRMNSPGASPPMDSILEFRVMTGSSAEFGRSAGANVNMAIKSGTNRLHGSAYEFLRNDKLDANDFFANRENRGKVPYRQNQYGVSAGGPVLIPRLYDGRQKTFWFASWEGFRSRRGSTGISTVPVAEQRSGDFSQQARAIYDPFTSQLVNGAIVRRPFAGNRIPTSRIHAASRYTLDTLIPLPNRPGLTQNFVNTEPSGNDRDAWVMRFDHYLSSKDVLAVRYLDQRVSSAGPASFPSYYSESRFDEKNVAASWNRTLGPSSTFEVRFGYHEPWVPTVTKNRVVTRADFLKNTGIRLFQEDVAFATIPVIAVTGQFSASASGVASGDHVYQWVANHSKVFGRHNLRSGVNYSRRWYFYDGSTPMHGTATFDTALTELSTDRSSGHATASFLLGYPASINRGQGDARTDGRQNSAQLYAQDDWRLTTKLTANLGLRYELSNPPYDVTDRVGTLELGRDAQTGKYTGTLLWGTVNPLADPVTGRVNEPARSGGYGRSLQRNDWNNFAPRIGLAYQIDSRTVVRAGVGVFYNSTFMQELQDKRKFYPYNTAQFFSANTGVLPDLSLSDPGPGYENTTAIGGWAQDPGNRTPYSEQWNLFVQRQVGGENTVEAGYMGSSNHRQIGYVPINTAVVPGPSALQQRRLLPEYGDMNGGLNDFASNYHALQLKGSRRFSKGLAFQVNYTWSRSMDYQSSLAETKTQNPFNRAADYSRSSWDLRHVFQFAHVYELPFGRGHKFGTAWPKALDYVAGGWAFEGIGRFQSGGPVNVTIGQDRANVGSGTIQRPNVTRNPTLGSRSIDRWFDTAAFEMPAAYTYGNAGAYLVNSDGRHNYDMSLAKRFAIRENTFLALRGEFFNLTNSVSFGDPNATLTSSSFGKVTSATAARQVQMSLRLSF